MRSTYKICEKLGDGSFAVVRRATHLQSKRAVALKIFYKPHMDKLELQQMEYECQVLARLRHPNVLPLLDIFECQQFGFIYVVLRYMSGTLSSYLRRKGKLDERLARDIFKMMASGVHHCHKQGIVHSDLKPDNILINVGDSATNAIVELRIADFGLSFNSN